MRHPYRLLTGLAMLGACLGALPGPASAKEAVAGVVIDLQGKPMITSPGEKERRLKRNEMVYEKDAIQTGAGERAAVAFVGGSELRINENSKFILESGGGRKETSVFTEAGQAWTRLLHKGAAGMKVGSPLAVAAVRGTEFDVSVSKNREDAKCYEGHCSLGNELGQTELKAGQMSSVGTGLAPEAARQMGANDYGSWQNGLRAKDLDKSLQLLNKEAEKTKTLELKGTKKDGKPLNLKIKLKKK